MMEKEVQQITIEPFSNIFTGNIFSLLLHYCDWTNPPIIMIELVMNFFVNNVIA